MLVGERKYETIWLDENDPSVVRVIDQQRLPFFFEIRDLRSVEDIFNAIDTMVVRGAPLIGAAAAFGMYFAALEATNRTSISDHLANAARYLVSCRPTAVNLSWAVSRVLAASAGHGRGEDAAKAALAEAIKICDEERENSRMMGIHGLKLLEEISERKKGEPVNILTHCNAGWLAAIDYGTATAPVYMAHEKGIAVHVWVDETRPRNQGSKLTAWELGENGVPCTVITDNTGGHLMQHGMVDIVLTGSDRTTRTGDVANKIGTYLKALAAYDNNVPFYAVLPSTSIDFGISDGLRDIKIEERDAGEVLSVQGLSEDSVKSVQICPAGVRVANFGFDVTPARLVTGLVTERGICRADENDIIKMFSDKIK